MYKLTREYRVESVTVDDLERKRIRMLSNKTFISSQAADTLGRKVSKDRITVMPCSNATGRHKL